MNSVLKEDIINAFSNKSRKRNLLLYEYYKEAYFDKGYTAQHIALKVSKDLGISISPGIIYKIKHRIIKKQKAALASQPVSALSSVDTFSGKEVIKENKTKQVEKVQEDEDEEDDDFKYIPKNTEDKPRVNAYAGMFNKNKEKKEEKN